MMAREAAAPLEATKNGGSDGMSFLPWAVSGGSISPFHISAATSNERQRRSY